MHPMHPHLNYPVIMKTFNALIAVALLGAAATNSTLCATDLDATRPRCSAEQGQRYIDEGRYEQAVREFTCLIENDPTAVEGYRGRIEAELLLGHYSDALADHAQVTARVLPVHPDAEKIILDGYAARLAAAPNEVPALVGASFTHWADFEYPQTIQVINHLLDVQPSNVFGTLFRGSARLLKGLNQDKGDAAIERAVVLAAKSAH